MPPSAGCRALLRALSSQAWFELSQVRCSQHGRQMVRDAAPAALPLRLDRVWFCRLSGCTSDSVLAEETGDESSVPASSGSSLVSLLSRRQLPDVGRKGLRPAPGGSRAWRVRSPVVRGTKRRLRPGVIYSRAVSCTS